MLDRMFIKQLLKIRNHNQSSFWFQLQFANYASCSTRSSSGRNLKENGQTKKTITPNKPYSYMNYPISTSVNDFRQHHLKIGEKLDDETIKAFKELVEKVTKEFGNDYRSSMLQERNQELINDMLISASESQIVDIFEFCSSRRFMINLSENSLKKIHNFYNRAKLINRYKILTTNFLKSKVTFADFCKEFTSDQRETMLYTYSPQLIKLFIAQIYLPLGDRDKIDELLSILKDQEDTKNYNRFEEILDAVMYNQPLNLTIDPTSSMEEIIQILSEYLISSDMLPKDMINKFHYLVIYHHMRGHSSQQLQEYLALFYPNFLDAGIEKKNDLVSNFGLSSLVDENQLNPFIMKFFFKKVLNENRLDFYEKLQTLAVDNQNFQVLLNSASLEHAYTHATDKSSVEMLKSYELSYFNKAHLYNLADYYSDDFDKLLRFIKSNNYWCTLTEAETDRLLTNINENKRNHMMRALISNHFNFRTDSIVLNWIGENRERFDFVITGGNTHTLPENLELGNALKLLTPSAILKCLTKIESRYTSSLIQMLPLENNYYYALKKMQLLNLTSFPQELSYIEILDQFLEENGTSFTDQQILEIYNTYIIKVIRKNTLEGLLLATHLVPSYKNTLSTFSGVTGELVHLFNTRPINLRVTVPKEIIMEYVKSYKIDRNPDTVIISLFKNVLAIVPDLKLGANKSVFLKEILHTFAEVCIENNLNPSTLVSIYRLALTRGLDPTWRIDDPKIISNYVQQFIEAYSSSGKVSDEVNLIEMLALVSTFQNRLELHENTIEILFNSAAKEDKIPALNVLRKALVSIPYVKSIADFIHQQVKENNPKIYESIGLVYENPIISDSGSKYYKWPKFDPRYFAPFMEKFMETIVNKDGNVTLRRMLNDSLANMNCDKNYYECSNFAELYKKVSFFENAIEVKQSTDLNELIKSVKVIQEAPKPKYLDDPFIIHYLVSKGSTYKLETVVQMLNILTKGDLNLGKLGFWELFDRFNIPQSFKDFPKFYQVMTESKLLSLHRLLFTSIKFSNSITPNELSYFINISENIMNCDLLEKKNKYMVINCVLIIIEKHSDLLSTFYKRMINIFPEYRVSVVILTSLLHSVAKNDFGEIDGILKQLVKNNDMSFLNQASEASINRLIAENQNGLAQELYLKFCEFNPKFKIQEFAELNWKNNSSKISKQKFQKAESEQETKLGKFKVKLYDYDALDEK